jgi:hypothetical protein
MSPGYIEVLHERQRQEDLCRAGVFKETLAAYPGTLSASDKLAVLAEEFGEVSREVADAVGGKPLRDLCLRAELIQVAACCVAWVEGLDAERDAARAPRADSEPPMHAYSDAECAELYSCESALYGQDFYGGLPMELTAR